MARAWTFLAERRVCGSGSYAVSTGANEMELDKGLAERKLREHGGDPLQTLITLVTDPAALPGGTSS